MTRMWLVFLALTASPAAVAVPRPAADFFRDPQFPVMVISPSGRYVASLVAAEGATNIMIIDLLGNSKQMITKYAAPANVLTLHWKSDERLVYVSRNIDRDKNQVHDLQAVRRDGGDYRFLYQYINTEPSVYFPGVIDWLPEDPDAVLWAGAKPGSFPYFAVSVQTISGKVARAGGHGFAVAGGRNCLYVTDHHGDPRICLTHEDDLSQRLNYRTNAGAQWDTLALFRPEDGLLRPLAFAPDDQLIYVLSNLGRDTFALFEFDPASKRLGKPVFEAPNTDIQGGLFGADGRTLIGVWYWDGYQELHYFDPHLAALQESMIAAFPGRHATISSLSADAARAIIDVESDAAPGSFYLYDAAKRTVEKLADRGPALDAKALSSSRSVQIKTADGTLLQAYLSVPLAPEAAHPPLIVMPAAGPGPRFGGGWSPTVEFLAARGYALLRLNGPVVRNGLGLGSAQPSGRRWTLADVQGAIADAVAWAVAQGIADPARVAIFGEDFNGYLALMAMASRPELFRCGISYGGELDLQHLFDRYASSTSLKRERAAVELASWEGIVGSRKDAESLRAQSPIYHIANYRAPIFLAYSVEDLVVPFSDAERMRDELTRAHQNVILFSKPDEPHLFEKSQNKSELFEQIAQFLQSCNPVDGAAP